MNKILGLSDKEFKWDITQMLQESQIHLKPMEKSQELNGAFYINPIGIIKLKSTITYILKTC
jgi:hypothetical protein